MVVDEVFVSVAEVGSEDARGADLQVARHSAAAAHRLRQQQLELNPLVRGGSRRRCRWKMMGSSILAAHRVDEAIDCSLLTGSERSYHAFLHPPSLRILYAGENAFVLELLGPAIAG